MTVDLTKTRQRFAQRGMKFTSWARAKGFPETRFRELMRRRIKDFREEELEALRQDGLLVLCEQGKEVE